jgi:hypothetical protein
MDHYEYPINFESIFAYIPVPYTVCGVKRGVVEKEEEKNVECL